MKKVILFTVFFLFLMIRGVSAAYCGGATQCYCGDTLTSSYNMTSDLTGCTGNGIIIAVSNIILDCQGHKLSGNSGAFGIWFYNTYVPVTNVTVKNCIVTNFGYGIYLAGSSNNILTNNTASNNPNGGGIRLDSSSNNILTNNTASNNSNGYGIHLQYSSNNTIINNTAINNPNGGGIRLYSSSNNTIINNTANSNDFGINLPFSSNNILTGNTANSNQYDGIYLAGSSNNILTNNTAKNNTFGISFYSDSIFNILKNNSIQTSHTSSSSQQGLYITATSVSNLGENIDKSNTINGLPILYIDGTNRPCLNNTVYTNGSSYGYMGFVGCSNITVTNSSPIDSIMFASTVNSTISNLNISFLIYSITLTLGANYNNLINNTASNDSNGYGFFIYSSNNTAIINNTANSNGYGIYLAGSSNNNIINNTANSNAYYRVDGNGILLAGSSNNNTITNNTANSNAYYGIWLNYPSNNNTITNNTANSNQYDGIYLYNSSNNILTNNIANLNGVSGRDGIRLDSSSNNTLTGNTVISNYNGISLWSYSNNNILINNTANSNQQNGIQLYYASNNNILTNNTANSNPLDGIFVYTSLNNILTNNTVNSNDFGIMLSNTCSNNLLTNNTVNSNLGDGIELDTFSNNNNITSNTVNSNIHGISLYVSSDNILTSNTVNSNQQYGIYIGYANNNIIYNNYFNNSVNVVDDGTNYWNTTKTLGTNIIGGPYIGGNYWSDYSGVDDSNPSDGIGDTLVPYTSNGNIINGGDYLPLTTRVPIHCGDTLTSSYTMTSDLTGCTGDGIIIGASNIILDCQGHTINGNNPGYPYCGINNGGVFSNGWPGGYNNVTIKNCIINGGFYNGIWFDTASYGNIINNTASSNSYGIHVFWNSIYDNLINNTATSNTYGFRIAYTSNDTLIGNIANNNGNTGILLDAPIYISVINNTANSNYDWGIQLSASSNNILTGNTANSNKVYSGIMIEYSSNNTVTNNIANSNSYSGILLQSSSSNNTIYNNYFSNSVNAMDSGNNIWNTTKTLGTNIIGGSYIGGNFWSDYTGVDTNGDGLGNTKLPYNSSGNISNGGDYLPLTTVQIITPPNITILSPQNTTYYTTSVPLAFTVSKPASWCGYSLDGNANVTLASCANTTLTSLGYSSHNVIVYANDTSGNMGSSNKVYFTVTDTTPPKYSNNITIPTSPALYSPNATYQFNITWTDNVGVSNVILQMDGINYTVLPSGNTYSMTFSTCALIGGGGGSRFYLMDMSPIIPLLMLISIFLSFVVSMKKKYNVLSVILIALVVNLFFVAISGADASACLNTGDHYYKWYANDTSNNWNSTSLMTFTIKATDPVSIYVTSPKNTTYSANSVDLKYSISSPFEISWIGYSLDNKPNVTLRGNTSLNLAEGSHNMIFYANTTLKVMNSSQRVYFTVSLPKPDLIIDDIWTSGSTINYRVKNQGTATAGPSYSNLWVDSTYITNDYLSSLAVGSSNRTFSYSWTCSGTNDTIKVCADANSNVTESNETNNCLTKTFTCPVCTCTAWVNTGNVCTGMVGGCYYKYVRTCAPKGCSQESQCVYAGKYCAV